MAFSKASFSFIAMIVLLSSSTSLAHPGFGWGGKGGPFGGGSFGLFPEFYQYSCPQADDIVMSVLRKAIARDSRIPASLLRLHFHDCFVQSGGPNWELPLGRRDSKTASLSGSNNNLPPPNSTIQNLVSFFKRQGLNNIDLVALSGAHTIGVARCVAFKQRLYNQNGNNQPDQTLEKNYFLDLKSVCPRSGGDNNISPLDLASPAKFDNTYFKLLIWGKGLLTSDEVLYTGKVGRTIQLVKRFAEDEGLFFEHFAKSMVKMGNISPLTGFNGELALLVSHELSLSGGPLLLMELAFLLRRVGAEVVWITNQKPAQADDGVAYSLERKMLDRGVQVFSAKSQKAIDTAMEADLVVLNTAVAGKWLEGVLKENVKQVLPKVLWWIHEMRGHYFKLEYVKHLPFVAGAMIDSHTTAEYWKNRTRERLGIKMPETYVVHLGNSKDHMEVAEDIVAKRVLREHVRESLGVRDDDLLFAIINSVSRGKGQDLFLRSFYESLQLIQEKHQQVPSVHAIIVGSDLNAQTKFETELRNFVLEKKIQNRVHFVNKTLTVAPYLAAIDVLVQNSQARGECFGRITIEAMAFQLPVLGTAAGGTMEIVVNGTTGLLHPTGKEGVTPLANNIVKLATHVERRLIMGKKGYERVKGLFLEHHMSQRISLVLKDVLRKAKS
ncbi:hypothetical protein OIU78_012749 [Salix suchowensis]|nr:hypothetical protein OIU78_012749 [Salix suchowensis]